MGGDAGEWSPIPREAAAGAPHRPTIAAAAAASADIITLCGSSGAFSGGEEGGEEGGGGGGGPFLRYPGGRGTSLRRPKKKLLTGSARAGFPFEVINGVQGVGLKHKELAYLPASCGGGPLPLPPGGCIGLKKTPRCAKNAVRVRRSLGIWVDGLNQITYFSLESGGQTRRFQFAQ